LATLANIKYPSGLSDGAKFYEHNLCRPLPESPMPGKYRLSLAVGIGVTPDPQVMEEVIQEKWDASVASPAACVKIGAQAQGDKGIRRASRKK